MNSDSVISGIDNLIGKKIQAIHRVVTVEGIHVNWDEGPVEIIFDDGLCLYLTWQKSGFLKVSQNDHWNDPLKGDLDEETLLWIKKYGKEELRDVSDRDQFRQVIGRTLTKANPIYLRNDMLVGVRMIIDTSIMMDFYVRGDECVILWNKTSQELYTKGLHVAG